MAITQTETEFHHKQVNSFTRHGDRAKKKGRYHLYRRYRECIEIQREAMWSLWVMMEWDGPFSNESLALPIAAIMGTSFFMQPWGRGSVLRRKQTCHVRNINHRKSRKLFQGILLFFYRNSNTQGRICFIYGTDRNGFSTQTIYYPSTVTKVFCISRQLWM